MGVFKSISYLFVFLILVNISFAYTFETYQSTYTIVDDNVLVQINIESAQARAVKINLPSDASTVELYLNDQKTDANIRDNSLTLDLKKYDKVSLSYITEEFIDNNNFLLNLPIEYNTNNFKITVILPEEATLRKPIRDSSGSIYPRPDQATTDGRSLIFIWEKTDAKPGDEAPILIMYKTKNRYLVPGIIIAAAVIFSLSPLFIRRRSAKKKNKKKNSNNKEPKMLNHLKDDEQQIVRILKQRKGSCEQGTLRVVTGFSKASLSRLISELEARKIVYKEKRGKKNLIFLK